MNYFLIGVVVFGVATLGFLLFRSLNLAEYLRNLLAGARQKGAASFSPSSGPQPLASGNPAAGTGPSVALLRELEARKAALEARSQQGVRRNRFLTAALIAGAMLLLVILGSLYQIGVRSYAVLEDVQIRREPANQGRLEISFRVVQPGKVFYQRTSGKTETEVVDYFHASRDVQRSWSWVYEPGKDIDVSILYRGGLWRQTKRQTLPTARSADIVILMDTTGSMSRSIAQLKEKCVAFSTALRGQDLEHRFALVGFGDTNEPDWIDTHAFTADVEQFKQNVSRIKRFDGGDLPESALDAIEQALSLSFADNSIRRFYLVTDAAYHEPTRSGRKAADLAAQLAEKQILLQVFCRAEFEADYAKLLGPSGKFQELEAFGKVLSEGRVLED